MAMSAANDKWRTVRVFVSSTFRDMYAERDYLARFVFPRLRDELRRHRVHLVDVDLRWGVTAEQDPVTVCRRIIDECRPRFICLLGGRYGTVPEGSVRSITADEVHYAVLDQPPGKAYNFFYIRAPEVTAAMVEDEPGEFREPAGSPQQKLLDQLKAAIARSGRPLHVYPARWDVRLKRLTELEELGRQVYADVAASVEDELGVQATPPADEFAESRAAIDSFVEERTAYYVVGARQALLDEVDRFVESEGAPNVLALTGEAGVGKSSLLASFLERCRGKHPEALILAAFLGAGVGSTDLRRVLRRFCQELAEAGKIDRKIPQDLKELMETFWTLLQEVADEKRVVIVLDALNQLDAAGSAHGMAWLPSNPAVRARFVVSSLEHPALQALRERTGRVMERRLQRLSANDAEAVIEVFLGRFDKRMQASHRALLLSKADSGNPLYLLAALEELRTLCTHEEIESRIRDLPERTQALFAWILARLERDPGFRDAQEHLIGADLVRRFAGYIAASRNGLSEDEIIELIDAGDPLGNVAALQRLLRPYLMFSGDLVTFYHGQLRQAVEERYLGDPDRRRKTHRSLAEYFCRRGDPCEDQTWSSTDARGLSELPHHEMQAGMWSDLKEQLTSWRFLEAQCAAGRAYEVLGDYAAALVGWPGGAPATVAALADVATKEARHLQDSPLLAFPQMYNRLAFSQCAAVRNLAERARTDFGSMGRIWLRAIRQPRERDRTVLAEHCKGVLAVATSPDGQYGFSASADGKILGFRLPTGEPLWQESWIVPVYDPHEVVLNKGYKKYGRHARPQRLVFTDGEHGRLFATAVEDTNIIGPRAGTSRHALCLNALDGNVIGTITRRLYECDDEPLVPTVDGNRFHARDRRSGAHMVWDAASGSMMTPNGAQLEAEAARLNAVAGGLLAYDGRVAVSYDGYVVTVSDICTGEALATWRCPKPPLAAAQDPNRRWLALHLGDEVRLRSLGPKGQRVAVACTEQIRQWSFADDRLICLTTARLLVWHVPDGRTLCDFTVAAQSFRLMAGGRIVALTVPGEISPSVFYDVVAGCLLGPTEESTVEATSSAFRLPHAGLWDFVPSSQGWLALMSVGCSVELWAVEELWGAGGGTNERRIALWDFAPGNRTLATVAAPREVHVETVGGNPASERTLTCDEEPKSLRLEASGARLAWLTDGGQATVVDVATGETIAQLATGLKNAEHLRFAESGNELVIWSRDVIDVWSIEKGKRLFHRSELALVGEPAYAPPMLVAVTDRSEMHVYHVQSGARIRRLKVDGLVAQWQFERRTRRLAMCIERYPQQADPFADSDPVSAGSLLWDLRPSMLALGWVRARLARLLGGMFGLNLRPSAGEFWREGPFCNACFFACNGRALVWQSKDELGLMMLRSVWSRMVDWVSVATWVAAIPFRPRIIENTGWAWRRFALRESRLFPEGVDVGEVAVSANGRVVVALGHTGRITMRDLAAGTGVEVYSHLPLSHCRTDAEGRLVLALDRENRLHVYELSGGKV